MNQGCARQWTLGSGGSLVLDRRAVALAHFLQSPLAGLAPQLRDLSILAEVWRVREHLSLPTTRVIEHFWPFVLH